MVLDGVRFLEFWGRRGDFLLRDWVGAFRQWAGCEKAGLKRSYWAQGLEDHGWDSGFWNLGKEKGHRPEVAQNLGLYKSL